MKIEQSQIKEKQIVGITSDGQPVLMIQTHGGLFAFFAKKEGQIETLATGAHKAIASWVAEKKSPGLKWNAEFLKSEGQSSKYETLHKAMFAQVEAPLQKSTSEEIYIVYDTDTQVIGLMDQETVIDGIACNEIKKSCLIRPHSLSEPATRMEFHPLYKAADMQYNFRDANHVNDYLKRGHFAVVSAHRHDASPDENKKNHESLRNDIMAHGYMYTPMMGNWGNHSEPSYMIHRPGFMVHEPDNEIIAQLAKKYKQTAHLYSNHGKHQEISHDPSYKPMPGGKGHQVGAFDNDYSVIDHGNGMTTKFRLNLAPTQKSELDKARIDEGKTDKEKIAAREQRNTRLNDESAHKNGPQGQGWGGYRTTGVGANKSRKGPGRLGEVTNVPGRGKPMKQKAGTPKPIAPSKSYFRTRLANQQHVKDVSADPILQRSEDLNKWQKDTTNPMHGIIDPKGQFHPMANEDTHESSLKRVSGLPYAANAFKAGFVSVGHNGTSTHAGEALADPNHPATKTLRAMMKKYGYGDSVYLDARSAGASGNYDVQHFIRHGQMKPYVG